MKSLLLVAALLLTPTLLTSCNNCRDSGICPFVDNGPDQPYAAYVEVTLARGSTTQIEIPLTKNGVPDSAILELFSKQTEATAKKDPNLLAYLDAGRVTVRRSAQTFTGSIARISVSVDADATLSAPNLVGSIFGIRRVGSSGPGGTGSINIKVIAKP
ncbi:hypothetical protein FNU79_13400 [Deinococcus detaillensis]|uniref:Uncharacterized protein n=1 Tax=Deinococcus detaillensis TaxID=2592048 RepID=A0A553UQR5_9DEIO|nr:hypothetical protein [Deinococcus detaillensis]TSA82559.1 hypothetical protein FNU79_13400 [Deinococcus detaillensis]